MKSNLKGVLKAGALVCFLYGWSGCVKDNCMQQYQYTWYQPVYKTSAEVRAEIKSGPPMAITSPGKIVTLGNYLFLNEIDKGIHILDNSNPASPKNMAFIAIPGNVDLAIKGNLLYADLYTDLVTIDISNPLQAVVKSFVSGVFPDRYYGGYLLTADSNTMVTDWIKHDTTVMASCNGPIGIYPYMGLPRGAFDFAAMSLNSRGAVSVPVGTGGSMSRFALIGNDLYTVGNTDLSIFNITNGSQPVFANKIQVDWHVETIYPFKNTLFVGTNNGTYMYDVSTSPESPSSAGQFTHARSCDPVIADDNYAYITLHSGTSCLGYNNELDIVKLNQLYNADLVMVYSLTSPMGLSKDGTLLFICDGTDGLKVFDATDVMNLKLLRQFPGPDTYDVIAQNGIAIVVASDGLYQYDYSDVQNIHLISKMGISK
ncbi:MAG: hypothetical protein KGM98_06520 [Bacteroidota bacterium]|nr:hypothetical protein [Bacteroidota bacterium]